MTDRLRCRYSDCVEAHPVAHEEEGVTCPTCRDELGLPLIPRKLTRNERLQGLADQGIDTWRDYNGDN